MTVALVERNLDWTVTLRVIDSGAAWPAGLCTEDGTWFQKPFHWPESWGSCGESAMAMF